MLVNGTDLSRLSANDQARLRRRLIGYVFQDFNLLAGFAALENVAIPLELDGVPAKAARAAGMTALIELGVDARVDHFPDQLSGGERQRVAIARAVIETSLSPATCAWASVRCRPSVTKVNGASG